MMVAAVSNFFGVSLFAADAPAPMAPAAPAPAASAPAHVGGGCAADCGGGYVTVKSIEYVKEMVPVTRTTYKKVWKDETYTVNKTEYVKENRTRQVTVMKPITETVYETRTVTKKVPVKKTVTVMESRWETQQVTEMQSRKVRKTYYTQECVERGPSLRDRLKAHCDPCYTPCTTTELKCRKHHCWETVCEPVTKCKKVKVCVPVCKEICTYECVTECIKVPVCKTRCVPECKTECYTVCVPKCVPVTCTRKVAVCVPCTETVMECRLVAKCVEKQVACAPACNTCCEPSCCEVSTCCAKAGLRDRVRGLFAKRHRGECCDTGCEAPSCCH